VILGDDNKEYFLHCSNISSDVQKLSERTLLKFDAQPRPKNKGGFEAIDAEVISRNVTSSFTSNINKKPDLYFGRSKSIQRNQGTKDYWYQRYTKPTCEAPSKEEINTLDVKVVGVTYEGRQTVVSMLSLNEDVLLVREPNNLHDRNAIKVMRTTGEQIGYLSRYLAAQLAEKFDLYDQPVKAIVTALPGGLYPGSSLGVRIRFTIPGN